MLIILYIEVKYSYLATLLAIFGLLFLKKLYTHR